MKIHAFSSKEQIENHSYETTYIDLGFRGHSVIIDFMIHSKIIQNRCKYNRTAMMIFIFFIMNRVIVPLGVKDA